MDRRTYALWLVFAVSLGLMVFSLAGIIVNGFRVYLLYPLILGLINIYCWFILK
jgi:hypothetical protein